jgi:hypothetical protein
MVETLYVLQFYFIFMSKYRTLDTDIDMLLLEDGLKTHFSKEYLLGMGAQHPKGNFSDYLFLDRLDSEGISTRYVFEPINPINNEDTSVFSLRRRFALPETASAPE